MSVQDELKEGIYEVYSNFYDLIQSYPFDPENSQQDTLYGEFTKKVYKDPVGLLAKPSEISPEENEVENSSPLSSIKFTVPLKSFELGGIEPDTSELKKGIVIFNGVNYRVKSVIQSLNIQGAYLSYDLICEEDRR